MRYQKNDKEKTSKKSKQTNKQTKTIFAGQLTPQQSINLCLT